MSVPLDRLKSALSARYRIEREVGRGATATVYLAHDVRHSRRVAVKVLNPDLAATLAAERFLREIEIAAALTHPYILPVLDSGEEDGFLFYVMPYVEGESLRERLDREGELPLRDAVRIAREVADGLAHAHEQGVVHRDIKPANVLLPGRHASIADFGVARAIERAAAADLTGSGLALGTPAYMSPEQAAGDEQVDARSDVYAVGCLLYEMLTGRPPLAAPTPQATLARRMTEQPSSIRAVRDTVSADLERVVMRALARSPADRFQSAEALATRLRRASRALSAPSSVPAAGGAARARRRPALVAAGVLLAAAAGAALWLALATDPGPADSGGRAAPPSAADLRRIAVFPFEDLSADGSLGHLASGFTRTLIDELGDVEPLDVVSYNGVAPFRGTSVATDSVARALGVGALVAGAINESEGLLRVNVELIEAASGGLLDSERFERRRGELFALQDDIARELAEYLRTRLGTEIRVRERAAATSSAEAWELVQRAEELRAEHRPLWKAGRTEEALELLDGADELLARAESLDPGWVEPTILRGQLAERRAELAAPTPRGYEMGWAREALRHAERALREEPGAPEALALRGRVRFGLYRQAGDPEEMSRLLAEARNDLEAALAADPSLAEAWSTLARLHQSQGEYGQAKRAAEKAYEEDAFLAEGAQIVSLVAEMALELGDYHETLRWTERGRRKFPDFLNFPALELLARASAPPETEPDPDRAWSLYRQIDSLSPPAWETDYLPRARMQVAAVLAQARMRDSARAVIMRTRSEAPPEVAATIAYDEANAWLRMDRPTEAIEALRRHLADNPSRKPKIATDAWFERLRDDPSFRELVGESG